MATLYADGLKIPAPKLSSAAPLPVALTAPHGTLVAGNTNAVLTAPHGTLVSNTGNNAALTAPHGTLVSNTGINAALTAPHGTLVATTGNSGITAALTAPHGVLVSNNTCGAALTAPAAKLTATAGIAGATPMKVVVSAHAPKLVSSGKSGGSADAALICPAPSLVVVGNSPAVVTALLTARAARIVATLLPGSVLKAALKAATPIMAAAGYPAYTITAVLTAPKPYLNGVLINPAAATYATYVLNTRKHALSAYGSEWQFNSYTVFNGVVLGCNANGVSVLGTQGKDNAAVIDAVARTGAESFGSSFHKRVPRIYTSGTFAGDMLFRTITDEGGTRTYSLPYNAATGLVHRRVPVGKGPKSRFWSFELENVAGADFSINDVMVMPTTLRRRVQ